MSVLETIRKRYSCRAYQKRAVEKEKLDSLFEAARLAPSAKNLQDWRFVVVTDEQTKKLLRKAANDQKFVEEAAAVIIGCSNNDETMRCGQRIGPIDVSIALEHIALQATESGLATCWVGSFYPEKVRAITDIPDDVEIIELMAIGYPADTQTKTNRQPMKDILCYEKWRF